MSGRASRAGVLVIMALALAVLLLAGIGSAANPPTPLKTLNLTQNFNSQLHGVINGAAPQDAATVSQLNAKGVASVLDYGAVGDGETNDTTAIQATFDSGYGEIVFPSGSYYTGNGILHVPGYAHINMQESNSSIIYTGSSDAVLIEYKKGIIWSGGTIDLTGASPGAVGIHIKGLWNSVFVQPRILMGAGMTGIEIETGNTLWGSFCLSFINPYIWGSAGSYGIYTHRTAGEETWMHNTHIMILNGYITGQDYPIYYQDVENGNIISPAIDAANKDGITIRNCSGVYLMPGETANGGGNYRGVNFLGTNDRIRLESNQGVSVNTTLYHPSTFSTSEMYLKGSDTADNYYLRFASQYDYTTSLILSAKGGGNEYDLIKWGDSTGMIINPATGNLHVAITDIKTDAPGTGLICVAPNGTHSYRIRVDNSGNVVSELVS